MEDRSGFHGVVHVDYPNDDHDVDHDDHDVDHDVDHDDHSLTATASTATPDPDAAA